MEAAGCQLIPHVCGQGLKAELVEPTQALCGCLFFFVFFFFPPTFFWGTFFLMAKLFEKM